MIKKKPWNSYTEQEKLFMKDVVTNSTSDTPFSPEYAAAYLGKSVYTLQYMRCHSTDSITYSKVGRHVIYRKKHLDEYINRSVYSSTSSY